MYSKQVLCVFASLLFAGTVSLYAQDSACKKAAKNSKLDHVICIELQNAPNNMEPVQQPGAVRVDNREQVSLVIENESPLESCIDPTRASTPTLETNPFQALLTSITGLGAFSFAPGTTPAPLIANVAQIEDHYDALDTLGEKFKLQGEKIPPPPPPPVAIPKIQEDEIYIDFQNLFATFRSGPVDSIGSRQAHDDIKSERGALDQASWDLLTYMAQDYRGSNWKNFNPLCLPTKKDGTKTCAVQIGSVQERVYAPIKAVDMVAQVQGNLDILTGWNGYLHKKYEAIGNDGVAKNLPGAIIYLEQIDRNLDNAKAIVSVLNDGVTAIKTSQTALRTAYLAAAQLQDSAEHRMGYQKNPTPQSPGQQNYQDYVLVTGFKPTLQLADDGTLFQSLTLGSDRKTSVTGTVPCISQIDQKTAMTDTINYSITYQDLTSISLSAGLLTTFQQKEVIGIDNVPSTDPTTSLPTAIQQFAVTDSARVQVFPMAFLNFRVGYFNSYHTVKWGRTHEERLLVSGAISTGIGVNSNSGTNQPEFFLGPSIMLNKFLISPGAHFGRVERIGGGFNLGDTVPSGFSGTTPPLNWSYRPAFSIGFSYRIAPW